MELRAQQDHQLRQSMAGDTVVMFTDRIDTAENGGDGDLVGRQKLLNALLFPIIRTHGGTIVKTIDDRVMACFGSAGAALSAAEGMQRAIEEFNGACRHADEEVHIRVGLHSGSAAVEDGDLHGDAVDGAARVQARAAADEVWVTDSVAGQVNDRELELIGPVEIRGAAEPVDVHRLSWRRIGPVPQREAPRLIATRYRLGQLLGRGPFGVVYSAEDVRLRVPVAIKMLHEFVSQSPRFAEVFLDRVQTMASLLHPAIVRVIDCSARWAEEPYYITERIDGRDLGVWVLRNGCPPARRAARILARVGEALDFGHRHGVVHGNLKPENILMRSDGAPSVSDFGLGCVQQLDIANVGGPLSSPSYQAPEQVIGERIDQRADIYSLGAVMYFLFAGRPPFEPVATLRAQRAVASGMYRRLHRVRPDLPHYITEVTSKAMAHSPDERFATTRELTDALHAFAGTENGSD
jgi:serine/threonine-protein kinase